MVSHETLLNLKFLTSLDPDLNPFLNPNSNLSLNLTTPS